MPVYFAGILTNLGKMDSVDQNLPDDDAETVPSEKHQPPR